MDDKHSSHETETVEQKKLHEKEMARIEADTEALQSQVSERKLLMKTDIHVVPILFLLFLCAFVDR